MDDLKVSAATAIDSAKDCAAELSPAGPRSLLRGRCLPSPIAMPPNGSGSDNSAKFVQPRRRDYLYYRDGLFPCAIASYSAP